MVMDAVDYRIYQRRNGHAQVRFAGTLPADNAGKTGYVAARAVLEDDNLTVVPWTICDRTGDDWTVTFTLPEGGLYRLEAVFSTDADAEWSWCGRVKLVRHIGVGELFLLAGQSNMSGYGRESAHDPVQLGVHLYGNNGRWNLAAHPLNDSIDSIYPENYELANATSPALAFARTVMNRLHVPVGLITAALGGSPLRSWHPEEDGVLYRAMLRRLDAVGDVGNILWYQGCSDGNDTDAPVYLARFQRMIQLWREQMGDFNLVTVQLNRVINYDAAGDRRWGMILEAQRRAPSVVSKCVVISTSDLPLSDLIHNSASSNVVIGERMANAYLDRFFGLAGMQAPSVIRIERVGDDAAQITFDCDDVLAADESGKGFDFEDDDGLFGAVSVKRSGCGLLVHAARPFGEHPRLHGYWRCTADAFVPHARHGMPMLSFYNVPIEAPAD